MAATALTAVLCGLVLSPGAPGASEQRRSAIVVAVERARASVVNIQGEKSLPPDDLRHPGEQLRRVNGMGTGVVIDERGYIVTNHHVVEGVPDIKVTLADESTHTAQLVHFDARTDLAVIKIEAGRPLPVIETGTSSDLMIGESVIAVGNAFGYMHTVTRGIVSALHRSVQVSELQSYDDLIQTDASINPGNSGGPLLNIDGQMIGINVAVRAGAQGIGFAIPVDTVMDVAADLLSTRRRDIWHGVVSKCESQREPGLRIASVDGRSPAEHAGLKPGDVIVAIDDLKLVRPLDIERAFLDTKTGDTVSVTLRRDGEMVNCDLVLADLPPGEKTPRERAWDVLGLTFTPVAAEKLRKLGTSYNGGLAVLAVRPESPAQRQGIQRGDVLIGMHVWETVSLGNVEYVLTRPDLAELEPLKFYILRDNQPLFGQIRVARRDRP